MRAKYVVCIPETITAIIAAIAVTLSSIALYKDAYWQRAVEDSVYFQPYLTLLEENAWDKELSEFRRDIFYQVVVTLFLAPTVLHLFIHLILTVVQRTPEEDYDEDELETPEEDPEFLSSTPENMFDTPAQKQSTASQFTNQEKTQPDTLSFAQKVQSILEDRLFQLGRKKLEKSEPSSTPAMTRNDVSRAGPSQAKAPVSNPNFIGGAEGDKKKIISKSQSNSGNLPAGNFEKNARDGNNAQNDPGNVDLETNPDITTPTNATDEQVHTNKEFHFDFTQFDVPFLNPRLLKLLLLASIIFECMLAFSAAWYQLRETNRFETYYTLETVVDRVQSRDENLSKAAIMLVSCPPSYDNRYSSRIGNSSLMEERDAMYVCQDLRAKIWVVILSTFVGISGLITTVVIYVQYRDTLSLTYGGQYPANKKNKKLSLASPPKPDSTNDNFSGQEIVVSPEEMRQKIRHASFSEDEKLFSGYTVNK